VITLTDEEILAAKKKHVRTRYHRERIIEKRMRIVRDCWGCKENFYLLKEPGRLSKWNLTCDCMACNYEKIFNPEKPKYKDWR
jgi:hypothetical protein